MGIVGCTMDRVVAPVLFNERVRPAMWRLGLRYDALARGARPASFVMLGFESGTDPLLPRPFSVSDAYADERGPVAEILYKPVGRATTRMTRLREGDALRVLGVLGNGYPDPPPNATPVLIAGGIGNAPFALHVRTLLQGPLGRAPQKIVLILAGRRDDEIYIQDVVRRSGVTIVETTDDGSRGEKGFATDALRRRLSSLGPIEAYACGPTPMLRAVKALAAEAGFRAWLSVEEPMACGFGVCNACVVRREGADLRYAKACQEGPVFDAAEIRP